MSITFVKAPKPIDFAGNGLEFKLNGTLNTTPSYYAYMTLGLTGSLTGYFEFYDIELEELFRIDAVASPDVTKNEIYSGLDTAQLIADALNTIYQFRKYYIATTLTTYLEIYRREKGEFTWTNKYTLPACLALVGNIQNGQTGTVKSNYSIYAQLCNYVNQLENIISEFNYNVDKNGNTGSLFFGPIVKPYINISLPNLLSKAPFFIYMDKFLALFAERYDVDGISTTCRFWTYDFYALKGKITPEFSGAYGLITEIDEHHIYLNHFTTRDIFTGARYLLNFINLNEAAETVVVKAKIYYTDLTDETKTIYSIATTDNTKLHSFYADPTSMNLASYSPTKEIYKYEVWVEHANASILCNSFVFNIIAQPMFFKEFIFLNKYGAWEIFHLVSKENIDLQLDKSIVKLADNQTSDAFIEAYNKFKISTGSLTRVDALELQYMLMSEALYEIKDDTYTKLIIEPGTIPIIEDSADITSEEFSYRKSTDL